MKTGEIHYKVPWRTRSSYPGHHPSQQKGGGLQFRNHARLIEAPDPRRFDVRASLRDPFGEIQVRAYQQTSSIPIYVIADLSASMSFGGAKSKASVLAEFVDHLSYSAYRTGDLFGFIGCAEEISKHLRLPATLNGAAATELAKQLRAQLLQGKNSESLLVAADLVGSRRALVFLVSDFHFSVALLEKVLGSLAYHDVVPVMLWDRFEYENLPDFGLARVNDRETGRTRVLLMRPVLKRRIQQIFFERRDKLFKLFGEAGRTPLLLHDDFDPDEVTRYFFD